MHGGCRDGFCAAWVCKTALEAQDPEFHEGYYGQAPPDVAGRDVVIVDFSYPLPEMQQIAKQAKSVLVLDHHVSAKEALASFAGDNVHVTFDMNKSGARLAWDHYFPGLGPPWLVAYVEDRDLWRFALKNSKEVNAWISVLPFEFDMWSYQSRHDAASAATQGGAVVAKMNQYVREVSKNARLVSFHDQVVPLVNAPQTDISELLDRLRQGHPFAIGWWQRGDGKFQYSLRSKDYDVSRVAKAYGGGGHRNAAGFESDNLIPMVPVV
jgi:uncharacterized protein